MARKKMRRPRRQYMPEFKARVVELFLAGRPVSSLSEEFDVHETTIRSWVWRARIDSGQAEGLTTDERAELAELRRENSKLREERESLKKFAAWSAQESNWTPKKRSGS